MKIWFLCFLGLLGSYGLLLSNAQDMTIESQFHPFIDVGNEFIIDTSIVYGPAPRSQYRPSVAFDGTNYFVVWREYYYGVSDVIYGARVDRSCDVLDPLGIAISSGGEDKWWPCIAYGNTSYLVVWTYDRGGDAKICGARVSQSGVVLDTLSIDVSPPQHLAWHPSVAFDGTNYFVVWSNATFGNYYTDIFGARVSQDGTLLDTSGIPI
ncbi:hypothetical protein KAX02_02030 [candidate division WOR-3 bacterium]|nr:hypothetical protein [candidate division WOR-3 bacterium]